MSTGPALTPGGRRLLFFAACAGIFMFGIVLAVLGTLFGLPEMRERLGVDLAGQGNLLLLLFLGVFAATLLSGPLIDGLGNKPVLFVSALLVTAAMVLLAAAQSFASAALACALLGFGGGGLNTATNALVSDIYGAQRGPMLNLLGVFFGFGALFIPLTAASITGRVAIPSLLLGTAVLPALCTLTFGLLRFPPAREAVAFSLGALPRVARYPVVILFALLLFCQSGNESSIGGFVSTYLGTLGASPHTATWVLAGYWGALMLGRLLAARLLRHMSKESLVLASGVGSLVGTGLLLLSGSLPVLAMAAGITGLSFAAIYPTTLAMAGDRYQSFAASVFGFLFAVGLLGGMSFPWAIGQLGQAYGVQSGMVLPVLGAAGICVLALLIRRRPAAVTPSAAPASARSA